MWEELCGVDDEDGALHAIEFMKQVPSQNQGFVSVFFLLSVFGARYQVCVFVFFCCLEHYNLYIFVDWSRRSLLIEGI